MCVCMSVHKLLALPVTFDQYMVQHSYWYSYFLGQALLKDISVDYHVTDLGTPLKNYVWKILYLPEQF